MLVAPRLRKVDEEPKKENGEEREKEKEQEKGGKKKRISKRGTRFARCLSLEELDPFCEEDANFLFMSEKTLACFFLNEADILKVSNLEENFSDIEKKENAREEKKFNKKNGMVKSKRIVLNLKRNDKVPDGCFAVKEEVFLKTSIRPMMRCKLTLMPSVNAQTPRVSKVEASPILWNSENEFPELENYLTQYVQAFLKRNEGKIIPSDLISSFEVKVSGNLKKFHFCLHINREDKSEDSKGEVPLLRRDVLANLSNITETLVTANMVSQENNSNPKKALKKDSNEKFVPQVEFFCVEDAKKVSLKTVQPTRLNFPTYSQEFQFFEKQILGNVDLLFGDLVKHVEWCIQSKSIQKHLLIPSNTLAFLLLVTFYMKHFSIYFSNPEKIDGTIFEREEQSPEEPRKTFLPE